MNTVDSIFFLMWKWRALILFRPWRSRRRS